MKNLIFFTAILVCTTFGVEQIKANSLTLNKAHFSTDTTAYLRKNLINKKAKFLHQPLSVLLKASNLKVKGYIVHPSWKGSNDKIPVSITLFFEDPNFVFKNNDKNKALPLILVSFDVSPPRRKARAMWINHNGNWLEDEDKFYGSATVKDIVLVGDKKY